MSARAQPLCRHTCLFLQRAHGMHMIGSAPTADGTDTLSGQTRAGVTTAAEAAAPRPRSHDAAPLPLYERRANEPAFVDSVHFVLSAAGRAAAAAAPAAPAPLPVAPAATYAAAGHLLRGLPPPCLLYTSPSPRD